MELVFTCQATGQVFYTHDFIVIDNRGIRTDPSGNKVLDAKVALNQPCPFCGSRHVYHAAELACPFTGQGSP